MINLRRCFWTIVALVAWPAPVFAQASDSVRNTGVSGLWILANLSYAGMRAQNHASTGWRILAFIFGFPGTLLTFFLVEEGNERAYGVDLPKRLRPPSHPPTSRGTM